MDNEQKETNKYYSKTLICNCPALSLVGSTSGQECYSTENT